MQMLARGRSPAEVAALTERFADAPDPLHALEMWAVEAADRGEIDRLTFAVIYFASHSAWIHYEGGDGGPPLSIDHAGVVRTATGLKLFDRDATLAATSV